MSNEQIKKDLLIQRAFLKKELDQLRFIAEVTGTNQEKEIDKRLDRLLTIDKVLKELEKKKYNKAPLSGEGTKNKSRALKDELLALKPLLGTDSPEFYTRMTEIAAKYTSEEDKKAIANFVSERLQNIDKKLDVVEENAIKLQLQEVAEIVSLSYLAKKYFNKSRSWLYQRLNGNLVNGKPARFTQEELQTFNDALQDISKKIGSLSISY